tara:strand:+ start:199 stop:483 length:285 start_codon:yes stop_codon:yes gene_type:complete
MAFKKWHKSPTKKVPVRSWDPAEMKIIGWCLNKGIGIGISPDWKDDMSRWQIEISINKNTHIDPSRYDDETVYNKVIEYYKYYYNKYKTNTDTK